MDTYRLNEDGTIDIKWADRAVTLRRPLFGEYEKLRQSLDEARTLPETLDVDETVERRVASMWPRIADWWCETIATLRAEAGPPIEAGDLPAWLPLGWDQSADVAVTPFGQALTHWRSVPLARGGETPPTETTTTE